MFDKFAHSRFARWVGAGVVVAVSTTASLAVDLADRIKTVDSEFETVFHDLQDAVINRGLSIVYLGHIDKMLDRTAAAAVGGAASPYLHARYFQFCSASLTHQSLRADPRNIAMCPFLLFAYETVREPGKISIGYRAPDLAPGEASDAVGVKVHAYLAEIIQQVADEVQ
jgi:hypothetical protein